MLSFKLSMPYVTSWNGKWSGDGKLFIVTRKVDKQKEKELDGSYHTYRFSDGWVAGIHVNSVDAKEAAKLRRNSKGFRGYDWMVNSILSHGEIKLQCGGGQE